MKRNYNSKREYTIRFELSDGTVRFETVTTSNLGKYLEEYHRRLPVTSFDIIETVEVSSPGTKDLLLD